MHHRGTTESVAISAPTRSKWRTTLDGRKVGRFLLVLERSMPVGIISERDVMTTDIVCIGVDSSIEEAMAVMTERRCRHLPAVVDGRVVGIISTGDLVRMASKSHEYDIQLLREYLAGRHPG
jgi:CBS domain-containing protein